MPINIESPNGISKAHIAERLEINLLSANENVQKMQIKVYFNVETLFEGEKIAETHWDGNNPLTFDCENDPQLESAMLVISNRIGVKRYEQITAPPEIPDRQMIDF